MHGSCHRQLASFGAWLSLKGYQFPISPESPRGNRSSFSANRGGKPHKAHGPGVIESAYKGHASNQHAHSFAGQAKGGIPWDTQAAISTGLCCCQKKATFESLPQESRTLIIGTAAPLIQKSDHQRHPDDSTAFCGPPRRKPGATVPTRTSLIF